MNHLFNMSAALLRSIENYQYYKGKNGMIAVLLYRYFLIKHFILTIITGSDIHPDARIGKGLRLPHPNGVIIHQDAKIGDDCLIMQQVTIGQLSEDGAPVVGSGVYMGAGAKVLGKISIGDRAKIGANSVVLVDVPSDKTVVGIPARIV